MFEIAPSSRPPLAMLLAVALPLAAVAAILLRRAAPAERRRVLIGALVLGLLLTALGGACWSRRHAGTGTETARGFPRTIHARWVPFDAGESRAGVRWRGVVEGTLVYAAAAAVLLAVGTALVARRRESGST